jgi:hypothetical protein
MARMAQDIEPTAVDGVCSFKAGLRRLGLPSWCLLLCGSVLGQGSSAQPPAEEMSQDPVAMTVSDREITVSELCAAIARLPPPQAKGYLLHPALAAQWYGPLVALAEEAKREHLGASLNTENESEVNLQNGLAGELIQKIARDLQPTESQIQNYYATHQSEFERTKARHILISDATALASQSKRTAAEAKSKAEQIAAQLKHGADFAVLAEKESEDPYTKDKRGDLGDVSHHQMEPAVDQVLWSLAPGQTSDPFEGRFGYEIVQVEGRRTLPLDNVRESVIGDIKFEASKRRQQEIIAAAHITLKRVYMDAQLPCRAKPSTLPDSPR